MKKLNGSAKIIIVVAVAVMIIGLVTEIVSRSSNDADNALGFVVHVDDEEYEVSDPLQTITGKVDKSVDLESISYTIVTADDTGTSGPSGKATVEDSGEWSVVIELPFEENFVTFTAQSADGEKVQKIIKIIVSE